MEVRHERPDGQWVLLAEDDVLLRIHLAQYLRDCGYKVAEAISAYEAITILKRNHPGIEAVISNIEIAGDGFGLSQWLRHNRAGLPILLTGTAQRAAEAASRLCRRGSAATASESPNVLLHRIQQALAKRKQ
ncbi:response regulator [Bradyrhizobium sp. ARR65]|uniref:response regulator n=1 Tax=Bradyrhizobium sp. ARR65 TaxID=1040989 RepID=UPI000464A165|nr:response regulator [Bradyrhizobium sp. ARR65]